MSIEINPSIVTIEGVDYYAHPAKVESVSFHSEDHGIFTCNVDLKLYTGGNQGFGGYQLDEANGGYFDQAEERPQNRPWTHNNKRRAHPFLGEFFLGLTKVLGDITTAKGKDILALKEDSGYHGFIVGLATLNGAYFLPKVMWEALKNA